MTTLTARERAQLSARVQEAGVDAGLARVGVCRARSWTHTRSTLEHRRNDGLAGGMAFTYRKPARSSDPTRILRDARSLVVGAWSYAQQRPQPPDDQRVHARVARYATIDTYAAMEAALGVMAEVLRDSGHRAVVVSDENSLVDREAAWRAGIGFGGKNSNVLLPGQGSWFVLGSVVTNVALPARIPVSEECGSCRRCLDGCPTGAIVEPGTVDAGRCLSWLLQRPGTFPVEFRHALGDRIYGCDDCQEVCPPSRRSESHAEMGPPSTWMDALELLELDDEALLQRCDRWYIPGRDPDVVRRNLLVVIGNSGRSTPDIGATLTRFANGPNPMLAEHATWALEQLEDPCRT